MRVTGVLLLLGALKAFGEVCDDDEVCSGTVEDEIPKERGLMQRARVKSSTRAKHGVSLDDTEGMVSLMNTLAEKVGGGQGYDEFETTFLQDIMDMITGTSLPNLILAHDVDQNGLDYHWSQVELCGTTLDNKRNVNTSQWWAAQNAKNDALTLMQQCRRDEKTNWDTSNSTCHSLNQYVINLKTHANTAVPLDTIQRPEASHWNHALFEHWLFDTHNWHCNAHDGGKTWLENYEDHAEECATDSDESKNKKVECDAAQMSFEHHYCDWRREVVDACETYHDCRVRDDAIYNTSLVNTLPFMERRQQEYVILKKIECLIGVLQGADTGKTLEARYECLNRVYNFSHLVLDPPTANPYIVLEDTRVCTEKTPDDVEDAPCSADFNNYLDQATDAARSAKCSFDCIAHSDHMAHNYDNTELMTTCTKTHDVVPSDGVQLTALDGTGSSEADCEEACVAHGDCAGFSQTTATSACVFYSEYAGYNDVVGAYTAACRHIPASTASIDIDAPPPPPPR